MIVFENLGETDFRAYCTFGVNVKESDNPVGFFGTGFKYAIAILLRNHHRVQLQSGAETYDFHLRKAEIRGQTFQIVCANEQELGFTSDVGKNWKMWMAYRELYCNALDEGGQVYQSHETLTPSLGTTRVIVWGQEFEQCHHDRNAFILASRPLYTTSACEAHLGRSKSIFYRGIRVSELEAPSFFTYNITEKTTLTEDRTLRYSWDAHTTVMEMIALTEDEDFLRELALQPSDSPLFEFQHSFPSHLEPNQAFMDVVGPLVRDRISFIPNNFWKFYKRGQEADERPTTITLTALEEQQLARAIAFCHRRGYPVDEYGLNFCESTGPGGLGLVLEGEIWITREAFNLGTKMLTSTLIEEYIHRHHSLDDFTRGMQEHLFNKLISLGEELDGEPL